MGNDEWEAHEEEDMEAIFATVCALLLVGVGVMVWWAWETWMR